MCTDNSVLTVFTLAILFKNGYKGYNLRWSSKPLQIHLISEVLGRRWSRIFLGNPVLCTIVRGRIFQLPLIASTVYIRHVWTPHAMIKGIHLVMISHCVRLPLPWFNNFRHPSWFQDVRNTWPRHAFMTLGVRRHNVWIPLAIVSWLLARFPTSWL